MLTAALVDTTIIVMFMRNLYRTGRDDGGNCMFVDHLVDAVSEQHHELVEGLDLPLELDSVDQKDGNGDSFFAQDVQKWILQSCPSVLCHFT